MFSRFKKNIKIKSRLFEILKAYLQFLEQNSSYYSALNDKEKIAALTRIFIGATYDFCKTEPKFDFVSDTKYCRNAIFRIVDKKSSVNFKDFCFAFCDYVVDMTEIENSVQFQKLIAESTRRKLVRENIDTEFEVTLEDFVSIYQSSYDFCKDGSYGVLQRYLAGKA
ncbi:hypothetical protein EGC76_05080 [Pseudidiomarina gelatinasegens]|uniref:Uncharacterized protein n=1 Tax=Pseudidiomarina gelatinasegens TaxID=2487740 RepID=A0A451GEV4_9GAMM|nr:hypothetical protein [Pseudidiomarina gelatinasegens]RWU11638.1 hypothetical protein EGC76_05080 [Pseudidiomarina gelatinasegens]